MPLWYRPAYHFTESELRYGMESCRNLVEMSAFFKVGRTTIRNYMMQYYDHAAGMNLYDLFKKQIRERTKTRDKSQRKRQISPKNAPIEDIFAGKHPKYNPDKFQNRLILEGYLVEQCNICGFNSRRVTDYKIPLKLAWKNKDIQDHRLENLELVCYNCYYLYYGDILTKRYKPQTTMYRRARAVLE